MRFYLLCALAIFVSTKTTEGCGGGGAGAVVHGIPPGGPGPVSFIPKFHPGLHLGNGRCLYGQANVRMADGRLKKVSRLQIGDRVMAYSKTQGVHESPIVSDLFDAAEFEATIIEIRTSSGRKVQTTPQHSLFVRKCMTNDEYKPSNAIDVNVGQCVPRLDNVDGGLMEDAVVEKRVFQGRGVRQPVTESGTIVVDDVLVSCYDRVVNQDATHLALTPYRWLASWTHASCERMKEYVPPTILSLIGIESSAL